MIKFSYSNTKIIIYDLEFYVPVKDQAEIGNVFKSNPYKSNHLLLGGSFIEFLPFKSSKYTEQRQFWIWENDNNERTLVDRIYQYLNEKYIKIKTQMPESDLIFCGIGISRIDSNYLFAKFKQYMMDTEERLFELLFTSRYLDLEQISIPFFKNRRKILYPYSTKEMIGKFRLDTVREDGSGVWSLYENGMYEKIQERNTTETEDMFKIYQAVLDLSRLNAIAPKYSIDSINRFSKRFKGNADKESFFDCFALNDEEERYILKDGEDYKRIVLYFFDKYSYWNRKAT